MIEALIFVSAPFGLSSPQLDLAQQRLGKLGLRIERLPGGHLTTNEQPQALAALIAKFEGGLLKMPERQSKYPLRAPASTVPNAV